MGAKVRINVVSSLRDKRFLVVAEREWTIDLLRRCIENVFHRLYPDEPEMHISAIRNEFHSDIPLDYQVGDVLIDAGLVFAAEEESTSTCFPRYLDSNCLLLKTSSDEGGDSKTGPRKKRCMKRRQSKAKRHLHSELMEDSSSDRVTSTTSPVNLPAEQGCNLTPQLVEKICEDSEVDVETIEDVSREGLIQTHEGPQHMAGKEHNVDERVGKIHKVNTRKRKKTQ